jgi:hypothetical protein
MRNTLTSASGDSLKVTFNTKKSHREIKKVSVDSSKKAGFHKLKKKPVAKERCYCNEMYPPHDTGGDTSPHTISDESATGRSNEKDIAPKLVSHLQSWSYRYGRRHLCTVFY